LDGVNGLNSDHFVGQRTGNKGTETRATSVLHYFNQILVDVSDVRVKYEVDQFEVHGKVGTDNVVAVVLQEDIGHLVGDCMIEGKSDNELLIEY
jgi:hypothetical protein